MYIIYYLNYKNNIINIIIKYKLYQLYTKMNLGQSLCFDDVLMEPLLSNISTT